MDIARRILDRGLAVSVAVALLFLASPWASTLDNAWRDIQLRWLAAHAPIAIPDDIVVIGIDDESLDAFGLPVATLHRQIGGLLEILSRAGPKAVGVDIVLPDRSYDAIQPGLDAALARGIIKLRSASPLYVGVGATSDGSAKKVHPLFRTLLEPGLVTAFFRRDSDGLVRRFDDRLGPDGQPVPTLAGELARSVGVSPAPGIVHFAAGAPFKYISLLSILQMDSTGANDQLRATFKGKLILIGSLLAHDDQHLVPVRVSVVGTGNSAHGVFVHATQLRSLATGTMIREFPLWATLVAIVLTSCMWFLKPGVTAWAVYFGALVVLGSASLVLLQQRWSPSVPTLAVALTAGLSMRLARDALFAAIERRKLKASFSGLVSPPVLEEILAGNLDPGLEGKRFDVCVMFTDIRNFTTISETMAPETIKKILDSYFTLMVSAIHKNGGTLDKFIGDGIMAFFGAPRPSSDPCGDACRSARQMLEVLDGFNKQQAGQSLPRIHIGIGLHFGSAFVGYIGSSERHEYTAIGDTVNVAARLEGLCKSTGFPIVVSKHVQERVGKTEALVDLGDLPIKGRAAVRAYGIGQSKGET